MNENKVKLILLVATRLSEDQCATILEHIEENPRLMANRLITLANKEWEESEHPRHKDGRFAPGGSGRPQMTKKEAHKWDATGKANPNPERTKKLSGLKKEIDDLKERVEYWDSPLRKNPGLDDLKSKLVKKQREFAEAVREWKHGERTKIEGAAEKRIMQRKAKEYYELEDDIDYMQEKYRGDNPLGGELKFPKGKRGEKIKAKYEEMLKKRDELLSEIDWDKVEEVE